jgi:hemerythrin
MELFVFDDTLITGHQEIDSQHAWLFELANRVLEKIGSCPLSTRTSDFPIPGSCEERANDTVDEALHGLMDYVVEHFTDEERLMADLNYPSRSVHQALHAALSEQVAGYMLRYMNGDNTIAEEIVEFFGRWLTSHIMDADRDFVDWLNTRRSDPTSSARGSAE